MKYFSYALILTMLFSLTAFAANGNMNLISDGKLNGTQLKAGEYKMNWTGEGSKVQINIVGKGVKVTVPAEIVNAPANSLHDSVIKSADGTVQEVHFGGKKTIIKFVGTPEASSGK